MNSNLWMHTRRISLFAIAAFFLLLQSACGVAPHYEESTLGTPEAYEPLQTTTPYVAQPTVFPAPVIPAPLLPIPTPPVPTTGVVLVPQPSPQITITGLTNIPPVIVNQTVIVQVSDEGSSTQITPSTFEVQVAAADGSPVMVQTLALEPAGAGQVQQISSSAFQISVYQPGPVNLIASGTGEAGAFQQATPVNVSRQINVEWTEDHGNGDECSCDVNAVICSNSLPIPVSIGLGGPGGGTGVMNLGPMEQNQMSPGFDPVKDHQLDLHVGEISITLDGSIPVGAVTCTAVTMPNSDDDRSRDFKQSFNINVGQL